MKSVQMVSLMLASASSSKHIIGATIREHNKNLQIWGEYNNVNAALKQQLIKTIDNIHIRALHDRHTGFASITTCQLIVHLLGTYGNITPANLAENDIRFKAAYDHSKPIETLYSQIEDAMDYAGAGNNAYTANQVVSNAYTLICNTVQTMQCTCSSLTPQTRLRISQLPQPPAANSWPTLLPPTSR
jgi:hypothetical protein